MKKNRNKSPKLLKSKTKNDINILFPDILEIPNDNKEMN